MALAFLYFPLVLPQLSLIHGDTSLGGKGQQLQTQHCGRGLENLAAARTLSSGSPGQARQGTQKMKAMNGDLGFSEQEKGKLPGSTPVWEHSI